MNNYVGVTVVASLLLAVNALMLVRFWTPARACALAAVGFLTPCFLDVLSQPVMIQAGGLAIVSLVDRRATRVRYALTTTAVTFTAFVLTYFMSTLPQQEYSAQRKAKYPMIDLAERVPPPRQPVHLFASPSFSIPRELTDGQDLNVAKSRESALRRIHERSVSVFVDAPGFGERRMSGFDLMRLEYDSDPFNGPIPQPGSRDASAGAQFDDPASVSRDRLLDLHGKGFADFVNPKGWGYIKDRKHVAGFVPHRMSKPPGGADDWSLQTLDLVGLLMHDKPVAYVSENLPRMDQLKTAPTRDLDPFEAAGIAALRGGEDLYARQNATTLRMLGAIRAVEQCTTCHACDRGELLGAFSYTLGRAKP